MIDNIRDIGDVQFLRDIAKSKKIAQAEAKLSEADKAAILAAYTLAIASAAKGQTEVCVQCSWEFNVQNVREYFYSRGYRFVVSRNQKPEDPLSALLSWEETTPSFFRL